MKIIRLYLFILIMIFSLSFVIALEEPKTDVNNIETQGIDNNYLNPNCYVLSDNPEEILKDLETYLSLQFSNDEKKEYVEIIESEIFPLYNGTVCDISTYIDDLTSKLNIKIGNDEKNSLLNTATNELEKRMPLLGDDLEDPDIEKMAKANSPSLIAGTFSGESVQASSLYEYDTAKYLYGDTYVVLIFVDEPGNSWDSGAIDYTLDRINEMGDWMDNWSPLQANVDLDYGYYTSLISVNPNNCSDDDYDCQCKDWMNEALSNLGFSDSHGDGYAIDELNNYILGITNSQNVYPIFMIRNRGLLSAESSYSCSGEYIPRIALFYYESCILGVCNRHEADAYIHESLHAFSADDEYRTEGLWCDSVNDCTREVRWGYPNGNCDYCSGTVDSIMKCCGSGTSLTPSFYTKGQIGWGDHDGDSDLDPVDNCMFVYNPSQENADGDSTGNACDSDDDNDGILDTSDNCQFNYNPNQANNDVDSLGDVCDPNDDNDSLDDLNDYCDFVSGNYCNGCPEPVCQEGYEPSCPLNNIPTCIESIVDPVPRIEFLLSEQGFFFNQNDVEFSFNVSPSLNLM